MRNILCCYTVRRTLFISNMAPTSVNDISSENEISEIEVENADPDHRNTGHIVPPFAKLYRIRPRQALINLAALRPGQNMASDQS